MRSKRKNTQTQTSAVLVSWEQLTSAKLCSAGQAAEFGSGMFNSSNCRLTCTARNMQVAQFYSNYIVQGSQGEGSRHRALYPSFAPNCKKSTDGLKNVVSVRLGSLKNSRKILVALSPCEDLLRSKLMSFKARLHNTWGESTCLVKNVAFQTESQQSAVMARHTISQCGSLFSYHLTQDQHGPWQPAKRKLEPEELRWIE